MTFRTRLFGLIILGLLFLPIFLSTPNKSGQVLGTRESNDDVGENTGGINIFRNNSQEGEAAVAKPSKIGEIGSGVRATRESETVVKAQETSGIAILDTNTVIPVSSDKYQLGSSIQVTSNSTSLNLVVQGRSVLSTNTILVLDTKTFESLGGDIKTGKLNVTVKENE